MDDAKDGDGMSRIEVKIQKRGKDGWTEQKAFPTDRDADAGIIDIINKHNPEIEGSYRVILKVNGGYGQNHATGATMVLNLKGKLRWVQEAIFCARKGASA